MDQGSQSKGRPDDPSETVLVGSNYLIEVEPGFSTVLVTRSFTGLLIGT
jgi:hypothetical protein